MLRAKLTCNLFVASFALCAAAAAGDIPSCLQRNVTWTAPTEARARAEAIAGDHFDTQVDGVNVPLPIDQVRHSFNASATAADQWGCVCPTSGTTLSAHGDSAPEDMLELAVTNSSIRIQSVAGGTCGGQGDSCECPDFEDVCTVEQWSMGLDGSASGRAHFTIDQPVRAIMKGSAEWTFLRGDVSVVESWARIYDAGNQLRVGPRQNALLAAGAYRIQFYSAETWFDSFPSCYGGIPSRIDHESDYQIYFVDAAAGDLNCDGVLSVGDIQPFVLSLIDPAAFGQQFPGCGPERADTNCNGVVNVADIGGFVALIAQ